MPSAGVKAAAVLRQQTGRAHALLTGRGAAGIEAALRARGLRDAPVGLPANTCYIVLWAVLRSGNRPVLLDVDPHTGLLTTESLRPPLAAIIPCHLYGLPAPMHTICQWAAAHDTFVIEDAALAIGATVDGRAAGSWGHVSIFSFGPDKIVDHQGGGAALTDDPALAAGMAAWLSALPAWGDSHIDQTNQWLALYWALHQYDDQQPRLCSFYPALYDLYGGLVSYRLTDADYTGLAGKLQCIATERDRRLALAARYDAALLGPSAGSTLPRPPGSTLWAYPLLVPAAERDDRLHQLWDAGIHQAARWYPSLQPMLRALCPAQPHPPTPQADSLAARVITLPLTPEADPESISRLF
jgi:dTDP-4-amino-4,6-dideoxygalactose transaminase